MASMFNRELLGDFNFFLVILTIVFVFIYLTSLGLSLWALLFKMPAKFRKVSFLKLINKDFINSLEDSDRIKMMAVRRYLMISSFLIMFKFIFGIVRWLYKSFY